MMPRSAAGLDHFKVVGIVGMQNGGDGNLSRFLLLVCRCLCKPQSEALPRSCNSMLSFQMGPGQVLVGMLANLEERSAVHVL